MNHRALNDTVRRLDDILHRLPPPYGPRALPPPVSSDTPLDDVPTHYAELLRLADGADCGPSGEIRLWPHDHLAQQQWIADGLPGGAGRWYPIGDVVQNPVVVERQSGQVWWFGDLNIVWYTDTDLATFTKASDNLTAFINHYILGSGYRDHIATDPDDPWLLLLDTSQ